MFHTADAMDVRLRLTAHDAPSVNPGSRGQCRGGGGGGGGGAGRKSAVENGENKHFHRMTRLVPVKGLEQVESMAL